MISQRDAGVGRMGASGCIAERRGFLWFRPVEPLSIRNLTAIDATVEQADTAAASAKFASSEACLSASRGGGQKAQAAGTLS